MFGVPAQFREAVIAASKLDEATAAVRAVYANLQLEIDRRKPVCVASGKCCHFDAYGHRLYVTTLEMAAFLVDLTNSPGLPAGAVKEKPASLRVFEDAAGCRFQLDTLCSVHAIRPFGCRIFFCDPTAAAWQQQQYESFHAELKQLHDALGVEYFYVEWRAALAAVSGLLLHK